MGLPSATGKSASPIQGGYAWADSSDVTAVTLCSISARPKARLPVLVHAPDHASIVDHLIIELIPWPSWPERNACAGDGGAVQHGAATNSGRRRLGWGDSIPKEGHIKEGDIWRKRAMLRRPRNLASILGAIARSKIDGPAAAKSSSLNSPMNPGSCRRLTLLSEAILETFSVRETLDFHREARLGARSTCSARSPQTGPFPGIFDECLLRANRKLVLDLSHPDLTPTRT
jgi:hypothetical protein